ncbi:MAG: class IV adenylate cyclase [Thermoplasmatota archaeon]
MGPYEVEIKAVIRRGGPYDGSVSEMEEIQSRLVELGALPKGHLVHKDLYLSHPCRDLSATDEALRIRSQRRTDNGECSAFMTYKGPKLSSRSKARREVEVEIDDPEGVKRVLLELGFKEVREVEKHRSFLDLGRIKICLDMVEGLGYFLEAEIMSDDIQGSEEELMGLLKGLGLRNFERRSYLEMLREKQV